MTERSVYEATDFPKLYNFEHQKYFNFVDSFIEVPI